MQMVGNHSSGEAASHKLIGIGDAYEGALVASQKDDPMLAVKNLLSFHMPLIFLRSDVRKT